MSTLKSSDGIVKHLKQTASADGSPPFKYRIQLVDESLVEEATKFLVKEYIPNENLMITLGFLSDKAAVEELERALRNCLSEGLSLAALVEDDLGNRGPMIGCNVLNLQKGDVTKMNLRNDKMRKLVQTMLDTMKSVDLRDIFKCDRYLRSFGLAVAAEFEGRGVGTELLKARAEVCRLTNIPVTATVFSSAGSQKAATKSGFRTLATLDLNTYRIDGNLVYSNPKWPTCVWMAIKYF